MIQAQGVEYRLSEVVRSPLRPMVATFLEQLASLRSCLYTRHLIEKRGEKVALAIQTTALTWALCPCVGRMRRFLSATAEA